MSPHISPSERHHTGELFGSDDDYCLFGFAMRRLSVLPPSFQSRKLLESGGDANERTKARQPEYKCMADRAYMQETKPNGRTDGAFEAVQGDIRVFRRMPERR